ncbi:hypothetical protein [Flavobacterium branchiophilum]|nr:hypothetical protein [Flavobacterium branchiophilum]
MKQNVYHKFFKNLWKLVSLTLLVTYNVILGQTNPTVIGTEVFTISASSTPVSPSNIKNAAHYFVTNSGTNYLNDAIQFALNAGYKNIYIEEGTYLVNKTINFHSITTNKLLSGIKIEGAGMGTIIKPNVTTLTSIFNIGAFLNTPKINDSYCENNIISNIFIDLDTKIRTGVRIGARGQYALIENLWIQNAQVAETEQYFTKYVSDIQWIDNKPVEKETQITANVAKGNGAILIDLPLDNDPTTTILDGFFISTTSNPNGLAYESDFNKFNNIKIRDCDIGISYNFKYISLLIQSTFNGNVFNDIIIERFKTAVDFGPVAANCSNNLFSNFGIQPDKIKNQFVFRRIHGDRNTLTNINTFDWTAASPSIFIYDISSSAKQLTIENSNLRATANLKNDPFYIKDDGYDTKLINNNDVNGYTNNILRGVKDFAVFGQNYYNKTENDFLVQDFNKIIFGGGLLQNSSFAYQPTPSGLWNHQANPPTYYIAPILNPAPVVGIQTPLCVITNRDHNGTFQWTKVSDLLSNSTWNHIASQNVKMNNFAIVNNPAVPDPANAPGIRLDNAGNVRIGTSAPVAYIGYNTIAKLKIDGDVEAGQGILTTSGLPNGSFFVDGGERNDKCIVLSAGSVIGSGSGYNKTRMLNFFDFPSSNLDQKPVVFFGIEDRNDMGRFRMVAEANGFTEFGMLNKNQQHLYKIYEDGNNNVALTMPKANSALAIGTEIFSYPSDATATNDGNYKLVVNGKIRGAGLKLSSNYWSDFVFAKDYKLPTLQEVEKHIIDHGHLPNIPSEKEVVEKGVDMLEMAKLQMQKIEELTLYIIDQNKKIEQLQTIVKQLQKEKF